MHRVRKILPCLDSLRQVIDALTSLTQVYVVLLIFALHYIMQSDVSQNIYETYSNRINNDRFILFYFVEYETEDIYIH